MVNAFLWDTSLFFHIPKDLSTHAALIVFWNALIFWFLVKIIPGVEIRGIVAPLLGPILITITTLLAGKYATQIDWGKLANGVVNEVQEQRDLLKRSEARGEGGAAGRGRQPGIFDQKTESAPSTPPRNNSFEKF